MDSEVAARIAADIVTAYLANNSIEADRLPELVRDIRRALLEDALSARPRSGLAGPAHDGSNGARDAGSPSTPAVPISESIHDEFLVSLEDGKPYRSLRRHLMAKYAMTPDDYRRKWGLPDDYPMVAPSYARDRSAIAKRIGLGQVPKAAPASPKRRARQAKA